MRRVDELRVQRERLLTKTAQLQAAYDELGQAFDDVGQRLERRFRDERVQRKFEEVSTQWHGVGQRLRSHLAALHQVEQEFDALIASYERGITHATAAADTR